MLLLMITLFFVIFFEIIIKYLKNYKNNFLGFIKQLVNKINQEKILKIIIINIGRGLLAVFLVVIFNNITNSKIGLSIDLFIVTIYAALCFILIELIFILLKI